FRSFILAQWWQCLYLTAHSRATDLNMTKRYLALTGEDLKAEHEKATPISDIVGKRVRKV
ncbi:MAG TPA: hypothetical protein PKU87_06545, partial [Candidatus Atribacteria bacterium]|nr:hypothetical protein [Candidatus Atribacteria bacterium]